MIGVLQQLFTARALARREELGWNRKELAKVLGISPGTLANFECGKHAITLDKAADIAAALGLDLFDTLHERTPMAEENALYEYDDPPDTFEHGLQHLINRFSIESRSDTPDFILAQYLQQCLTNFNYCVRRRDQWHGFQAFPHSPLEAPSDA
jgi:transcriptional regulator with XRE-family HTH domain